MPHFVTKNLLISTVSRVEIEKARAEKAGHVINPYCMTGSHTTCAAVSGCDTGTFSDPDLGDLDVAELEKLHAALGKLQHHVEAERAKRAKKGPHNT